MGLPRALFRVQGRSKLRPAFLTCSARTLCNILTSSMPWPDANESEGRARMQHLCVDCLVDQNEALVAVGRASLSRVQREVIPDWLHRMIQDRRSVEHFKHLQLHDEQRQQQTAGRLEAILWFQRKAPGEAWACSIRACHTESNVSNHTHLLGVHLPSMLWLMFQTVSAAHLRFRAFR